MVFIISFYLAIVMFIIYLYKAPFSLKHIYQAQECIRSFILLIEILVDKSLNLASVYVIDGNIVYIFFIAHLEHKQQAALGGL